MGVQTTDPINADTVADLALPSLVVEQGRADALENRFESGEGSTESRSLAQMIRQQRLSNAYHDPGYDYWEG